jgi:hypothetical protein
VVVLVEHGGSGPTVAAPIALQIIREYNRIAQSRAGHVARASTRPAQRGDTP